MVTVYVPAPRRPIGVFVANVRVVSNAVSQLPNPPRLSLRLRGSA